MRMCALMGNLTCRFSGSMEVSVTMSNDFYTDRNGEPPPEKPTLTEDAVEPANDDIGDAQDLEDGDVDKPKSDPDETSL